MIKVALVGSGKIGEMICDLLVGSGDYELTLIDASQTQLDKVTDSTLLNKVCMNIEDPESLAEVLQGHIAVMSASPYFLTKTIVRTAVSAHVHYLDLTEDVRSTALVRELAENAQTAFIPQCGLAPGFISIVANSMCDKFDELDTVRLRVGALPRYPTPPTH